MKNIVLSALLLWLSCIYPVHAQIDGENIDDAFVQNIIVSNDIQALNKLIEAGLDVNSFDKNGETMLFFALTSNADFTIAKRLIDAGADVNLPSLNGMTPLIIATATATALEEQNVSAVSSDVQKEIQNAFINQQKIFQQQRAVEMAKILIENGADVNQETPFGTPLMNASTSDANADIVSLLLQSGAKVNQTDRNGRTALFYATAYGAEEITPLLIKAGADIHLLDAFGKSYMDVDKKTLLDR